MPWQRKTTCTHFDDLIIFYKEVSIYTLVITPRCRYSNSDVDVDVCELVRGNGVCSCGGHLSVVASSSVGGSDDGNGDELYDKRKNVWCADICCFGNIRNQIYVYYCLLFGCATICCLNLKKKQKKSDLSSKFVFVLSQQKPDYFVLELVLFL